MRCVRTSTGIGRAISVAVVFVMLLGATEAPAQTPTACAASGHFIFTLAEGSGFLTLSADGRAEMALVPGHQICDNCGIPGRILTGTYRAPRLDNGQCWFTLDLVDPGREPAKIEIVGVVAFQGSVLLFMAATLPSLGAGLAIRADALTQPSTSGASRSQR